MASTTGDAVSPSDLDNDLRAQAASAKTAVHHFDPDATPEEKAAAAGKGRDKLKSVTRDNQSAGGKEVQIATGGGLSVTPTITISDADDEPAEAAETNSVAATEQSVPGALPADIAPLIPDWYKVGWRSVSGIDDPLPEGVEKDKNILDVFLSEQLYGEWYHNAAIIFFAVFASHFLTVFHFGWGWLFIVLACCATYYSTSIDRVRRRARDDIQRELVKTKLITEHETADWINNFLDRFWLIYEPVLSATIVSSVDQILSTATPAGIDSIRLSTFTLGTKAPRIESVKTFPRTPDDIVVMDWALSFTPSDHSDLTIKQAKAKMNPKIVLSIRIGKGFAGATLPILLEDINFKGHMRIRLKLMTNFPHIQLVDISFLEKPVIDYALKPVGGEHGLDIANIPGLSGFIREQVHASLGPMMYDPNVFTLNLEQLLSGAPLDTAIGVLQVTVQSARGIKGVKMGGGAPDPYVSFSINNRAELAKTKYINDTYNPTWGETKFLLINSLTESLVMTLMDYNERRKDLELGAATFELSRLQEDANREGLESKILKDGKERGDLRYDVTFYPVLKPEKTPDGKEEVPETNVGIVRLTVHQAKDLDHTRSISGDLNPFARVYIGSSHEPILTTTRPKHTNNPVWEAPTEFLCADRQQTVITVRALDDRDFMKDPQVGFVSLRLDDLLQASKESGRDWWPLSACKSGKVRMTAEWKPLNMAGSLAGADQYVPPVGVMRLWLQKAEDVKNVEAALGGKSDPYVRVQSSNVTVGRTEVVNNNLNPMWDQIIYVPIHSSRETLLLEVMDYQHIGKDRSLGSVELKVSDLMKSNNDPKTPFVGTGKRASADPIRLDKGNLYKGTLHYVAEFVPAFALKDVSFGSEGNQLQVAAANSEGQGNEVPTSSSDKGSLNGNVATPTAKSGMADSDADGGSLKGSIKSQGGTGSMATAKTNESSVELDGISLTKEELLTYQSGIIVFNVKSGRLAKKGRLEVLLDDGYWPAFATPKSSSLNAKFDHVGEGFVKELDFGRVWLRLDESDNDEKDHIVGEFKGDAKAFLQQTLDSSHTFTLVNPEDEGKTSTVEIETRYIPVEIILEPRESINNQGILRVDLLNGRGIEGVDRGGKSDPFVVFTLNEQKVFKSQTKKKTLTPEWNEVFSVTVPSRVGADFKLEVFDWNQIENAKLLGTGRIELAELEPMTGTERTINLSLGQQGEKGVICIRLLFQPDIIVKSRKSTSTFSSAGRAMTQIGGLPVEAGKGVLAGVGAAGKGITGLFHKDHIKSNGDSYSSPLMVPDVNNGAPQRQLPAPPSGQASQPITGLDKPAAPFSAGAAVPSSNSAGPSGPGTLRVIILGAKDLTSGGHENVKPYVVLRLGDKEQKTKQSKTLSPDWNEAFSFAAGPSTTQMHVSILDHRTLGKDRPLAEGIVDIWRHVQPADGNNASDVEVELTEGQGLLKLRLEFDEDINEDLPRVSSVSTLGSPSKFSLRRRLQEQEMDD